MWQAKIWRVPMSELSNKAMGAANKVIGDAKVAAGKAAGDTSTVIKGRLQQGKGKAQELLGDIEGAFGDKV
jgi:uncharacterized protein YjbJ (UPF0337 family)